MVIHEENKVFYNKSKPDVVFAPKTSAVLYVPSMKWENKLKSEITHHLS